LGVTAGQNTLKLPHAYCIEIRTTRESMLILSVHLNLRHTTFIDEVISRIKCTEQTPLQNKSLKPADKF